MRNGKEVTFSRRAMIMAGGGGLVFTGLAARLVSLQVNQSDTYRTLSEDNQFNYRLLTPSRGRILDRTGAVIADNSDAYNVLMIPDQTGGVEDALDALGQLIEISPAKRERLLREIDRQPSFRPITVADNLDWSTFARVNVHAPELPGILPVVGEVREYPLGSLTAHVTGYVGRANEEIAGNDPLLRHPGFKIGRDGLELSLDERLRGEAGALKVEVDARGRVVRELPDPATRAKPGEDIRLTLDSRLQAYAAERLGEEAAAAVVMDVRTGDILAMTSVPSYDPNQFARGISQRAYDALRNDEREPLFKKAISGLYPPASTFKMLVALAAERHGVMQNGERIFCSGHVELGGRRFHCWRRRGHGAMNERSAIQESCDIYFYEAARRLGIDRIAETARAFGLGDRPDIDLPGLRSGVVPDNAWKIANIGEPWQGGETLITGIGQGFLLISPLQLAIMASRLATGRAVKPRLIADGTTPVFESLGYSTDSLTRVQDAMRAVCEEPKGTAYWALNTRGLDFKDISMAGKTGTAQVRRITMAERETGVREQDEVPWHLRNHGMFICFAPFDQPRYAVSVVIEHGGSGTTVAPFARDILRACFHLERDGGLESVSAAAQREGAS